MVKQLHEMIPQTEPLNRSYESRIDRSIIEQRMERVFRRRSIRLSRQSIDQGHLVEITDPSHPLPPIQDSKRIELYSRDLDQETVLIDIKQSDANESINNTIQTIPSFAQERIILSWKKICFSVKIDKNGTRKDILKGISGIAKPSQMLAIMGPSGAGKSTLLNILAGRITEGELSGDILLNGKKRPKYWKYMFGYVEQKETLCPLLTIRESITFAVLLRAGKHVTFQEKLVRVENIICDLGLSHCSEQVITINKGPSAGERKRLSIGIELAADPGLLLLDEPTSGLDATTAYNIMESINIVALRYSKTIIAAIHQPREDILFLFDNVLLLCQGKTVYYGSVLDTAYHFDRLGLDCPLYMNPADFFSDMISIQPLYESDSKKRIEMLHESWERIEDEILENDAINTIYMKNIDGNNQISISGSSNHQWSNSRFREFMIVLNRECIAMKRDKNYIFILTFYTIFYFVILGMTFFQLPNNQQSAVSRVGLLFIIPVDAMYSAILLLVSRLVDQKPIIQKEIESGSYRTLSIFLAKVLTVLVVRMFFMSVLCLSFYYIVGLYPAASSYFIFWGIMLSLVFTCHGFAFAIVGLSQTRDVAFAIATPLCIFFVIYGGILINPAVVPPVIRLLQYASIIRYAYMALAQNEFDNLQFTYEPANCGANGTYTNGTQVIEAYDLDTMSITASLLTLIGIGFVAYIIAYIGFRVVSKPKYNII